MAPLSFVCPKTLKLAPTGINTDVQSLHAAWRAMLTVRCPHYAHSTRELDLLGRRDGPKGRSAEGQGPQLSQQGRARLLPCEEARPVWRKQGSAAAQTPRSMAFHCRQCEAARSAEN